jgi:hypothetical protein
MRLIYKLFLLYLAIRLPSEANRRESAKGERAAVPLRLDPDVHAAVVKTAKRDDRSAQYVLERIVLDWLRTNPPEGALKKAAK